MLAAHLRSPAGAALKYTYSSGQKPLDGYTIKHGIGKGAFGEVYFGLSDGGKEVALKLIRDNLDIELRGIAQCLNLKHANLVHLYDLRTDARGDHWLVMEYIEGDSLRTILDRHPKGIAPELAAQWFQGLAAGVQHLYDHGIVHRDLKPGNIFLEKGTIKVGDYSLCKLMGSQRAGQTQSIGTVHYMAPEISTGNYNRQIDIYAAGIVLHEMLTGRVPFDGDSAGEILMKHLTSTPDLSKIPSRLVPVVSRALCKNPAHRFASIADMSKRLSEALSDEAIVLPASAIVRDSRDEGRGTRGEGTGGPRSFPPARLAAPSLIALGQSLLYAALLSVLGALAWSAIFLHGDLFTLGRLFFPTVACCWAVMIHAYGPPTASWSRRTWFACVGLLIGAGALWLDGYGFPWPHPAADPLNHTLPALGRYLVYFGLMFFVPAWRDFAKLQRPARFRTIPVLVVIFWAAVLLPLLFLSSYTLQFFFAPFAMAAVLVQLVSPWEKPPVVQKPKRLRLRDA